MPPRTSARPPLWRVMLIAVGVFWLLAALVFALTQWVVPAFYTGASSSAGGFDYSRSFGLPFVKTFGLWMAGILAVLGPFAALWQAALRGTDRLTGKNR